MNKMVNKNDLTNAAEPLIDMSRPYIASVEITGSADLIFHRYDCEAVEEKGRAAKNSKAKKSDNIESYIYRDENGFICMPGTYLKGSIVNAARFRQDPRSPRKSAMDLYKAGVIPLTELASLGVKEWEYEHKCRVVIQRNAVPRIRPAFRKGWKCSFDVMVQVPEYIDPDNLHSVLNDAGRLIGIADFRPTYGRFLVTSFKIKEA